MKYKILRRDNIQSKWERRSIFLLVNIKFSEGLGGYNDKRLFLLEARTVAIQKRDKIFKGDLRELLSCFSRFASDGATSTYNPNRGRNSRDDSMPSISMELSSILSCCNILFEL